MIDQFLDSRGRLGRLSFFLRVVALVAVTAVVHHYAVGYFDHHHEELRPLGYFTAIVVGLVCALAGLMQLIKRLQDAGHAPFLAVLMLVPGVNALFLLYAFLAPPKG